MLKRINYLIKKYYNKLHNTNKLVKEIQEIKKFLILKELCPELLSKIIQKVNIPENEIGEKFISYYLKNNSFIKNLCDSEAYNLVHTYRKYQSSEQNSLECVYQKYCDLLKVATTNKYQILSGIIYFLVDNGDPFTNVEEYISAIQQFNDINYDANIILKIMSFYIYMNQEDKAYSVYQKYKKALNNNKIAKWIPVAHLLYNKTKNNKFKKQAFIYSHIIDMQKNNNFEEYIKGKSVALVGNGPYEKGKNKASLIDSYDVVIRMNKYNLTPEYIKDYGSKTNAWIRAIDITNELNEEKGNPKFSLLTFAFNVTQYKKEKIDTLYKQIKEGLIFYVYPREKYIKAMNTLKMHHPSGGARFMMLIKMINPNFSEKDCFGFAFNNTNEQISWVRADNSNVKLPGHNLEYERDVLNRILK